MNISRVLKRMTATVLIVVNVLSAGSMAPVQVYAKEKKQQDLQESLGKVVYVRDGEGTEGIGQGTKDSPYLNIRTALAHTNHGDTLKLMGHVKYTTYEQHTDGSAKPLLINKRITIEGEGDSTSLMTRSGIQLGADVIFKNFNLQMIPETLLGRSLGVLAERSTTIFTAGYSLTLDGVNTKMSTNPNQNSIRPYISAGRYKGTGELGNKAVVRIINPVEETKIAAIYAGDFWYDTKMDVELHLDGKLLDTTLYAGGVNGKLHGNLQVNIYGNNNLSNINRDNFEGNINIRLKKGYFTTVLSIDDVNELALEDEARITLPVTGAFRANKVILGNQSILDFRHMTVNPSITGEFIGTENVTDIQQSGIVILNSDQVFTIGGSVKGTTRLNSNGVEYMPSFKEDHIYISANTLSEGEFSIEGGSNREFEIRKYTEQNRIVWKVCRKQKDELNEFHHFAWAGGIEQIVKPELYQEFVYPITFFNKSNTAYIPGVLELVNEFEYNLVREDGESIDLEDDIFVDWDYESLDAQLKLIIYNLEKAYGKLILTVKHLKTNQQIQKVINIYPETPSPSATPGPSLTPSPSPKPSPSPSPTPSPSPKPSASPSLKPSPSPSPSIKKPTLKLSHSKATLYTVGSKTLKIKATIVGPSKKVTYRSSNAKIAKVDRNGKVTALKAGKATISVQANGIIKKCQITVKKPTLSVNKSVFQLKRKKSVKIVAKATPGGKITYVSANKKIASVTSKGVIKGIKPGTTTITVKCNGISKKIKVIVKK